MDCEVQARRSWLDFQWQVSMLEGSGELVVIDVIVKDEWPMRPWSKTDEPYISSDDKKDAKRCKNETLMGF